MEASVFDDIVRHQISLSEEVLLQKAEEYADDSDRLHNFRVSAEVTGETPTEALAGMMVKHTVSIYDMIRSKEAYPIDKWEEKITDHINYLLLLKALIIDEGLTWSEADREPTIGEWFDSLDYDREERDSAISEAVAQVMRGIKRQTQYRFPEES